MKQHLVFYDAACPLCSNLRKVLKKVDWFHKIKWVPVQKAENDDQYIFLRGRDIYDEIHILTDKGIVMSGYYAIRKIFVAIPLTAPLGWLMHLPYTDTVGTPSYMYVSRNRYDWFGHYEEPKFEDD